VLRDGEALGTAGAANGRLRSLVVRVKRAGVPRVLVSHAVWPAIFQRNLQVNDCPAKLIRMRYRAVLYCCEPRSRLDDNAGTGWHW
jgi:hypothetical protein